MAGGLRRVFTSLGPIARRTDGLLTHLSRVLSSSEGVEAVLCTLCYTLVFVHSRLQRLLERQYGRLDLALVSNASKSMLPGETVIASIEPPRTRLSETVASTKALADLIADFRIFMRLWGLVSIYSWARDNYNKPPGDPALKLLVWAQVGASAVFQFLENGAYLASKGVLRGDRWARRGPKWDVWSNRFWLAHVLLESLRLLRVRQLRYNEGYGAKVKQDDGAGASVAGNEITVQSEALRRRWQRDFYANAGWLPLTLHWSFEDASLSPVSDTWLGLCGIVPGIVGLVNIWEQTS
ncbi:hypothetical protein LTR85_004332 [Meristemomyces frigidus]|nr:hypothetical protein LTR85_004332 [Meristemomyces frigidus]